jgi:thiosulfate/3-mercaptopyruvate sulfurtransferase
MNDEKYKTRLSILDCSWFLPTDNKYGKDLFNIDKIPNSKFFDIDEVCDKSINLPHMFPKLDDFIKNAKELDIRKNDFIVCYDRSGIFSSPRVWLTLKLFGAKNVAVLNGGYPKWLKDQMPIVKAPYVNVNFHLNIGKNKPQFNERR